MKNEEILFSVINNSHRIVFLTGAGVSTDSGIPDFQSLYKTKFMGYKCDYILSKEFFYSHPDVFLKFIKKYFLNNAKPNAVHNLISSVEKLGKHVTVITQNIDNLHQMAGSFKVIHMHGSADVCRCTHCKKEYAFASLASKESLVCDNCKQGLLKPNFVLYNENIPKQNIEYARNALQMADTLVVMGTRLGVAADYQLLQYFGGNVMLVANKSYVDYQELAGIAINAPFDTYVPQTLQMVQNAISEK